MNKTEVVTFANGRFVVTPQDLPRDAVADRDDTHGDRKTALVRESPTMKQGTTVRVLDIWRNPYGLWANVEIDGQRIDVRPTSLQWSRP